MYQTLSRSICSVVLMCLSACATPEPTVPEPQKPSMPYYTSSDVLRPVYYAQISLDLYEKQLALTELEKAKKRLPWFDRKGSGQSDLLAELTYLSHGTLSKLYIPSVRGVNRYRETRAALQRLKESDIQPLEFRLVSFKRSAATAKLERAISAAIQVLKKQDIDDVSRATIMASREVEAFFSPLAIAGYDGDAENRLEFYVMAAELLLEYAAYQPARDALKQAEKAYTELQIQPGKSTIIKPYTLRLKQIERTIKQQDPSLLNRLGRRLDQLVNGETEE